MMMMMLKSLRVETLEIFEDRRMSDTCGMWRVGIFLATSHYLEKYVHPIECSQRSTQFLLPREFNCHYTAWILCKNCILKITKCLCHFDLLQKTVKNSLTMV